MGAVHTGRASRCVDSQSLARCCVPPLSLKRCLQQTSRLLLCCTAAPWQCCIAAHVDTVKSGLQCSRHAQKGPGHGLIFIQGCSCVKC